jgi:methylaspartate mutase sigma subunit
MQETVVLGVIGDDAHTIGSKIIVRALECAKFNVVNLGTFVLPEDYLKAAIETKADGISVIILGKNLA